jgi:hypothetical protein
VAARTGVPLALDERVQRRDVGQQLAVVGGVGVDERGGRDERRLGVMSKNLLDSLRSSI